MDMDRLQRDLRGFCQSREDIRLAVLFGSHARDEATQKSDIDLSLLLTPTSMATRLRLLQEIVRLLRTDAIHLILMNHADPLLGYEIAREGKVLYQERHDTFESWRSSALRRYYKVYRSGAGVSLEGNGTMRLWRIQWHSFLILAISMLGVMLLAEMVNVEAADVECPILADTLLAGHTAEKEMNCGGRSHLRVKGFQGIVLFRFDMSALERAQVNGATLSVYCTGITGDAAGKTISEGISTIAQDWIEGTGDYTPDEASATFLWPGEAIAETWGEDDNEPSNRYGPIDALDVVSGFGGSLVNQEGIWEFRVDEWTDIELDAELVEGLVDGTQYGIAITRNSIGVNLDLASREHAGGEFAVTLVVHASGYAVEAQNKLTSTWADLKMPPTRTSAPNR